MSRCARAPKTMAGMPSGNPSQQNVATRQRIPSTSATTAFVSVVAGRTARAPALPEEGDWASAASPRG